MDFNLKIQLGTLETPGANINLSTPVTREELPRLLSRVRLDVLNIAKSNVENLNFTDLAGNFLYQLDKLIMRPYRQFEMTAQVSQYTFVIRIEETDTYDKLDKCYTRTLQ